MRNKRSSHFHHVQAHRPASPSAGAEKRAARVLSFLSVMICHIVENGPTRFSCSCIFLSVPFFLSRFLSSLPSLLSPPSPHAVRRARCLLALCSLPRLRPLFCSALARFFSRHLPPAFARLVVCLLSDPRALHLSPEAAGKRRLACRKPLLLLLTLHYSSALLCFLRAAWRLVAGCSDCSTDVSSTARIGRFTSISITRIHRGAHAAGLGGAGRALWVVKACPCRSAGPRLFSFLRLVVLRLELGLHLRHGLGLCLGVVVVLRAVRV